MSTTTAAKKTNAKKKKKKLTSSRKALLISSVALGTVTAAAATGYFVGRSYYDGKFLADTYINGTDVSGLTVDAACDKLGANDIQQQLTVQTIDGTKIFFDTSDFDYSLNIKDEVQKMYDSVEHNKWFMSLGERTDFDFSETASYEKDKLDKLLRETIWGDRETSDAELKLDEENGYVITPEVQGNTVEDLDALVKSVDKSVSKGEFLVSLTEDSGCYKIPEVTTEDLSEKAEKLNKVFNMAITYDFDYTTETLTGSELLEIVDLKDDGTYTVDEKKAMKYVEKLAKKYDTYNTERKFKATLQGKITVPPSDDAKYGWWIDQQQTCDALVEMLEEGESVESVDPIYYSTGYYDFTGVESARSKNDDIGKTYVEIDLTDQHLWYYKKGKLQYECYIVSGQTTSEARTTLPGVYKLWNKQTNYRMKDRNADGESWDTTCNYWNNVSLCGIGLHDSTWRGNYFGGTIYKYNGSHGCINMPYDGAKYIYDNVEIGTPVVMYY